MNNSVKGLLSIPSNVIYLKQKDGFWHSISDIAPCALKVLGTNELPTRFRSSCPAETVKAWLEKTHPDHFVMVLL